MIIDISQEILGCKIYPGDPKPQLNIINNMNNGDLYNLTEFSMCSHNGTHIDAPRHFINNGLTIDEMPLDYFIGPCYVHTHNGDITREDVINIYNIASSFNANQRILLKGNCVVTEEAANEFCKYNIKLLGNESQTFGPEASPMNVHLILLGANIALLEGIILDNVADGRYFLCAQPLNIKKVEGAPCRAILITEE